MASLAITLQYPKTVAANIVGISCTLAMKLMLKAADTPNLDIINVIGIKWCRCLFFIVNSRSIEPIKDMKYIEQKPSFGPVFM